MQVHARAPLSPIGRRRVIDRVVIEGWTVRAAAEAAGVSERTVYRWLARFRHEGQRGLWDRSSRPARIPHRTSAERVAVICRLRRSRLTGLEIAEQLGMAASTVSAVLKREGLGKRSRLEPAEPVNRYERATAGELIHIDVKVSGASGMSANASPAGCPAGSAPRPGSVGRPFTSPLMTTAAWPTSKSSTTRRRSRRSRSCAERSRFTRATASRSRGS